MVERRCSGWVMVEGLSRQCKEEGRFFHDGRFWCKNCRDRALRSLGRSNVEPGYSPEHRVWPSARP